MIISIMDNITVFKALGCKTRIKILKILSKEPLHISGLAKKISISVPVMSRHIDLLEKAGLIKKRVIGNIHLLSVDYSVFDHVLEEFSDQIELEISKNETIFDALKQLPGLSFNKYKDKQFISSINGEQGYYVYEVNGKPPDVSIDEFVPKNDSSITLKKIVPINKKEIKIKIRNKQ